MTLAEILPELQSLTVEGLRSLRDEIKDIISEKNSENLTSEREARTAREIKWGQNPPKKGDTICFSFNKKPVIGVIEKVNLKSVTVFVGGEKKYIKWQNILEITESAPEETESENQDSEESASIEDSELVKDDIDEFSYEEELAM
jgi:hypothetical protein